MEQIARCKVCGAEIDPAQVNCGQCESPVGDDIGLDGNIADNESYLAAQGIKGEEAQQILNFMENNPGLNAEESLKIIGEIYNQFGAQGINLGEKPGFLINQGESSRFGSLGRISDIPLRLVGVAGCGLLLIAIMGFVVFISVR